MKGMDNLTILCLHDNAVTDMSMSLKALKSLTLLDVHGNKLTKVTSWFSVTLYGQTVSGSNFL